MPHICAASANHKELKNKANWAICPRANPKWLALSSNTLRPRLTQNHFMRGTKDTYQLSGFTFRDTAPLVRRIAYEFAVFVQPLPGSNSVIPSAVDVVLGPRSF